MPTHIQKAKQICVDKRQNFTPIREAVLDILIQSDLPMSAYDILDQYRQHHVQGAQPPTIYRALSFLEENEFIHRMASTRQFVVCEHIGEHNCCAMTPFFICDQCGTIDEGAIADSVLLSLGEQAKKTGFVINQPSLEIHGICQRCQAG